MNLLHVSRIEVPGGYQGQTVWRVIDPDGQFIQVYDAFQKVMVDKGYSYTTRERYSPMPARLIDFMYELGIVGVPTTNEAINQAIQDFRLLLEKGANAPKERVRNYARAIGTRIGLDLDSWPPTLAAINLFLTVCQDQGNKAIAHAKLYGLPEADLDNVRLTIEAVSGLTIISEFEKKRMRQNTLMGGVVRMLPGGVLTRPAGLGAPAGRDTSTLDPRDKDFPLEHFESLVGNFTSYRDKAYYCLQGGGGLRGHEARNVLIEHIDLEKQLVYVYDPRGLRFSHDMTPDEKVRFKGRATSRVYLPSPWKEAFFKYVALYLKHEYIPGCGHRYLFQVLQGADAGKPLAKVRDSTLAKAFRRAVDALGIPGPDPATPRHRWTAHSLRHMYGVYLLNYIPVPGGFGLKEHEVQQCMGHKDINSTRKYARTDRKLLDIKLEAADRIIYEADYGLEDLPKVIAARLMHEARCLQQLADKHAKERI